MTTEEFNRPVRVYPHWTWKCYTLYDKICRYFGRTDQGTVTLGAYAQKDCIYLSFINLPKNGESKVMFQMGSSPEAVRGSIKLMQLALERYEQIKAFDGKA